MTPKSFLEKLLLGIERLNQGSRRLGLQDKPLAWLNKVPKHRVGFPSTLIVEAPMSLAHIHLSSRYMH